MLQLLNLPVLLIILAVYLVMSLFSFVTVRKDKKISERNARRLKAVSRVPERTLHILEAAGGWLGSLLAQQRFRHKTQQRKYQLIFRIIVIVHLIALAVWFGIDFTNGPG